MKNSRSHKIAKALERKAKRLGLPIEGRVKAELKKAQAEIKTEQTLANDGMENPEYRRAQ